MALMEGNSLATLYYQYMQLFIKQTKLVARNDYKNPDPDYALSYSNLQRQMYHLNDEIIQRETDALSLKE